MPEGPIQLDHNRQLPAAALHFRFARSGGPGGQNVNKLSTKAILTLALVDLLPVLDPASLARLRNLAGRHLIDNAIVITSEASRSQFANRQTCIEKLRALIRRAQVPPKPRRPTKPSRSSRERRLTSKKRASSKKQHRQHRPDFD